MRYLRYIKSTGQIFGEFVPSSTPSEAELSSFIDADFGIMLMDDPEVGPETHYVQGGSFVARPENPAELSSGPPWRVQNAPHNSVAFISTLAGRTVKKLRGPYNVPNSEFRTTVTVRGIFPYRDKHLIVDPD